MAETIRIEADDRGIATLSLARPQKHNAMSAQMIGELAEDAKALAGDAAVRVIVLTGDGPTFCAGGDLGWMKDQMAADAQTRRDGATTIANMLRSWNEMPKPVNARLQGNAFGGGLGLASVADVAIALGSEEDVVWIESFYRVGSFQWDIGPPEWSGWWWCERRLRVHGGYECRPRRA